MKLWGQDVAGNNGHGDTCGPGRAVVWRPGRNGSGTVVNLEDSTSMNNYFNIMNNYLDITIWIMKKPGHH